MKLDCIALASLLISFCKAHLTLSQLQIYGDKGDLSIVKEETTTSLLFHQQGNSTNVTSKPRSMLRVEGGICKFTLEHGSKLIQMRDNNIVFPSLDLFYQDFTSVNDSLSKVIEQEIICKSEDIIMIIHPGGSNWKEHPNNLLGLLLHLDDLEGEHFNNYLNRATSSTKNMSFIVAKVVDDTMDGRLREPTYLPLVSNDEKKVGAGNRFLYLRNARRFNPRMTSRALNLPLLPLSPSNLDSFGQSLADSSDSDSFDNMSPILERRTYDDDFIDIDNTRSYYSSSDDSSTSLDLDLDLLNENPPSTSTVLNIPEVEDDDNEGWGNCRRPESIRWNRRNEGRGERANLRTLNIRRVFFDNFQRSRNVPLNWK